MQLKIIADFHHHNEVRLGSLDLSIHSHLEL